MAMAGKKYRPTIAAIIIVLAILGLIYVHAWPVIYTLFFVAVVVGFSRFCLRPFQ